MVAEARASELEHHVTEMTAVAHAARAETDQLKADLEKEQVHVAGITHGRQQQQATTAAVPNPGDTTRCKCSQVRDVPCEEDDRREAQLVASSRSDTSIAILEDLPNLITPTFGSMNGTAAQQSLPVLRLAEAEERAASTERALLQARDTSKTAIEHIALMGRQLELARAAERAEGEGRRQAQARIVELERDMILSGQEQERIHKRAEMRLQSLRAAFEQEELEAGGKVRTETTSGRGLKFPVRSLLASPIPTVAISFHVTPKCRERSSGAVGVGRLTLDGRGEG